MYPAFFETEEDQQLHDDAYYQAILDEQRKYEEAILNEQN